jgi:hypothetical protein
MINTDRLCPHIDTLNWVRACSTALEASSLATSRQSVSIVR